MPEILLLVGRVARPLAVESEAPAPVSNVVKPFFVRDPAVWLQCGRVRSRSRRQVGRTQRVGPEGVLDVGEHQLLVLLFVVQAQLEQRPHLAVFIQAPARQGFADGAVHEGPVGHHFVGARTRQQPPLRARVHCAHGLVVGVEEEAEARVEWFIGGLDPGEHEGLEVPGGMREVPLGWARELHRLDTLVFVRRPFCPSHGSSPRGDSSAV